MLLTLKALHLLGLVMGLGFGLANIVVMQRMASQPEAARPALAGLMKLNSRIAFGGVILLWLTGLWLYFTKYAGSALGGAFHAKLTLVVVLTALAAYAQWLFVRSTHTGTPPPANTMRLIGRTVPVLALAAAALAVVTFN
jgi:uncharacterized membrane protein